ncbi:MAG: hypothetical protein ACRD2N_01125 [Vicinamibacterales bacterium]
MSGTVSDTLRELRRRDPLLFGTGVFMAILLVMSASAVPFDSRLILGINPWIKPMKFEISLLIFLWTLAWFMPEARPVLRTRAFIRWTPPVVMTIEIVSIVIQAARGTTSHFNNSSPLNAAIFAIMGLMITANTVAMLALLLTLRRDTPPARAGYLWGVRMGIALFILASLQGFVIVANNAHTVAAPDGGPGLPFVNWSTRSGDLRVAHFFGMHALQTLPLLGYLLDQSAVAPSSTRRHLVMAAGIGWIIVMAGLFAGALRGRPLIAL